MNLTKHFLFFFILVAVCVLGWNGCYTQLATNSDNSESVNNSPTIPIDQPPPMDPYDPPQWDPRQPNGSFNPPPPEPGQPLPQASSISAGTGTDKAPESPHRQSGYQRSPSTDQNNSRQADATPSRTSWSPTPTPSSGSNTRTSGSTRGGR